MRKTLARNGTRLPVNGLWHSLYVAHVPALGFTSSMLVDRTCFNRNAILNNFDAACWRQNKGGIRLLFDGTNDYCSLPVGLFDFMHQGTSWSLSWWASEEGAVAATQRALFATMPDASTNVGISIHKRDAGRNLEVNIFRGISSTNVISQLVSSVWPDSYLHCITVTYNHPNTSQTLKVYRDGLLIGTANRTANSPSSSTATSIPTIGANNGGGSSFWSGSMCGLWIWRRVLSDKEVQAHYNLLSFNKFFELSQPKPISIIPPAVITRLLYQEDFCGLMQENNYNLYLE